MIPKDPEGDSWGFARNFKTSNGSLRMPPTSNRGRLWKLRFLGPTPTFAGFLVIPKDPEGDSWGFARNFKTSNGSLRMLPTSNRGRLWKLRFLGPNPTLAGFLVIPKDSEGDSWVQPGPKWAQNLDPGIRSIWAFARPEKRIFDENCDGRALREQTEFLTKTILFSDRRIAPSGTFE